LALLVAEGATDLPSVTDVVSDVRVSVASTSDGVVVQEVTVAADRTDVMVSGLRNGVEYAVSVVAFGSFGAGPVSEQVVFSPTTGVEGEIGGVLIKRDDAAKTAPASQTAAKVTDVGVTDDGEAIEGVDKVALSEAVNVAQAEAIADVIEAEPQVQWAEPDLVVLPASIPAADAPTDAAWNITGEFGVGEVTDPDAGSGVTVAVIDTGITPHPDLDGRLVPGYDFVSNPDVLAASRSEGGEPVAFDGDYAGDFGGLGRDADPTDPGDWRGVAPIRDSSWHGTHTAGVIADVVPGAKIQPIRALSWRGGLLSDVAAGITWASGGTVDGVPANATPSQVINLSFSVQAACPNTLQTAIDDAVARGSVIVAAAGNNNDDATNYAPGNCANVITVGASNAEGKRASYSNYGTVVDASAPGGATTTDRGVTAASNTGTTTAGSPTTTAREGTSIAAAHTAAALAIIAANNPGATPGELTNELTGTYLRAFPGNTCDEATDKTCGSGLLQITAAGVPGIDVNLSVNVSGTDTLIADGSTVANNDTVTVGSAGLLSPGVGDREIRTTLDPSTVYSSGSAVAPEGWTIKYSANNGTTWASSEPPASSVTDVRATASDVAAGLIEGTSQIYSSETTSAIPSGTFLANAGGDGYDAFFYDDYVFNIFHHNDGTRIMCHLKATSERCPGFSDRFSVPSYKTSMRSTGWVDAVTGRLYSIGEKDGKAWAVCVDVSTSSPSFCGATELGAGAGSAVADIGEGVVSGRRLFGTETSGTNSLLCFDAALGTACPGSPITLTGASTTGGGNMSMTRAAVMDGYLFVTTSNRLYCFEPETLATCSGTWPATISPWSSNGQAMGIAPHVDSSETLDGVCYYRSDTPYTCLDLDGTAHATWKSPFTLGRPNHPHIVMGVETLGRFYYASQQYAVGCWDYSSQAACSGFGTNGVKSFPTSIRIAYGVTLDPLNPACLWMNTDAGYIYNFDAYTGADGCSSKPVITLQPSQFAPRYACSTSAGITEWTALRLESIAGGGSSSSVALTVRKTTGGVVPGWSLVPVSVGADLDMTGLDPAVSGSRPTFSFAFSGVTGTISTAVIALDYKGKGPELCVDTVATSASPPQDVSVTGALTENLGLAETFTQSRTFRIGTSADVVQETVPGAPTIVSGSGLNTTASVVFSPPSDTGGLPVTSYVVSVDGGSSWSAASEVSNGDGTYTVSVSGLSPGTTYAMRLSAVNGVGRGAAASVSVVAQLLAIDSLVDTPVNQGPVILSATTDDGLPLTYTSSSMSVCTVSGTSVTLVAQGLCELVADQAGDASADPIILPAQTPGSFTVLAAYFEPTVPGAPTGLTLTPGDGQVGLSWTAPVDDGYSDLTDYVVQYKLGGSWIPFSDGVSTATSALMAGLSNGMPYSFRVSAVNAVGTGSYTSTATATPATIPGAPTSLSASMSETTLSVSWTAPVSTGGSAISDYRVQYKLSTDGDWTTFDDGTSTSTSASITGLAAAADYDVQVTTINAVGAGGSTSTVNLTVTPGSCQATLAWSAPASPGGTITDYQMQYRESASDPWTTFVDGVSTSTGGTVTGLTNGSGYYFRVATIVDGATVSSYTSVVAGTPRTTPNAPTVSATPGNRQMSLSWSAPGNGGSVITDYVVEYKASGGSTWTTMVDGISAGTGATVTSLTNGSSFDFRVASSNIVGAGSYSATVSATPRTTPDAPTGASATVGDGSVGLSWTAPVDTGGATLTNYAVQYKTSGGFTWTTVSRKVSTTTVQTITGLSNGATYVFRVAAVNAAGAGSYATSVLGTPVTVPSAPRNLAATVSGSTATVTWLAPLSDGGSAITDYEVDYKLTTDTSWTPFVHSASAATSATLTGLTGLTGSSRYDIRIRTITNTGVSAYASIMLLTSPPDSSTETAPVTSDPISAAPSPGSSAPPVVASLPVGVALGNGVVLIDGELVSIEPTPGPSGGVWSVRGPDFALDFAPQQAVDGSFSGPSGGLKAASGAWVEVSGDGYLGGSRVSIYVMAAQSSPRFTLSSGTVINLGEVMVAGDGTFTVRTTVPSDLALGPYMLQVNGWSPRGQVRSVNLAMNVIAALPALRTGSLTKAAFFKGRAPVMSRNGEKKLRSLVGSLPSVRQDVRVEITAVSVSLDEVESDLRLASRRGRELRDYLSERGVQGTYSVTIRTEDQLRDADKTPPLVVSSKGKPLTTVRITYDTVD
jgi:hypothetical protein